MDAPISGEGLWEIAPSGDDGLYGATNPRINLLFADNPLRSLGRDLFEAIIAHTKMAEFQMRFARLEKQNPDSLDKLTSMVTPEMEVS